MSVICIGQTRRRDFEHAECSVHGTLHVDTPARACWDVHVGTKGTLSIPSRPTALGDAIKRRGLTLQKIFIFVLHPCLENLCTFQPAILTCKHFCRNTVLITAVRVSAFE
jgi:hypothetical protein